MVDSDASGGHGPKVTRKIGASRPLSTRMLQSRGISILIHTMAKRLPMVAVFVASAIAIAIALFRTVWFRGEFYLADVEIRVLGSNTDGIVTGGAFNMV